MIDLYKILDLDYNVSNQKLFKRFVEYSKKYHPDFDKSDLARLKFIEINVAYYILEYDDFRKQYDKLYKKEILKTIDILHDQKNIEKNLIWWIEDGKKKADEYLKMTYKNFYKKIPKKETVFGAIFQLILELFNIIP